MTDKQQAFVDAYIGPARFNATEAARQAGYAEPNVQGSQVKHLPEIAAAIEARLKELTLSANEVLAALTDQARGSLEDFLAIDENLVYLDLAKAQRAGKLHLLAEYENSRKVGQRIRLYDAQAALVQLGRHYKLFSDGVHADLDTRIERLLAELGSERETAAPGASGGEASGTEPT